jgi:hypothetical protein
MRMRFLETPDLGEYPPIPILRGKSPDLDRNRIFGGRFSARGDRQEERKE